MGYEVGKRVRIVGCDRGGSRSEYIGQLATLYMERDNNCWSVSFDTPIRHMHYMDQGFSGNSFPESSLQLLDESHINTNHSRRIKLSMEA